MLTDKEKQIWDLMDDKGRISADDRKQMRIDEDFAHQRIADFIEQEIEQINVMLKIHNNTIASASAEVEKFNNQLSILQG